MILFILLEQFLEFSWGDKVFDAHHYHIHYVHYHSDSHDSQYGYLEDLKTQDIFVFHVVKEVMTCVLQHGDAYKQEKHLTCNFHEPLSFRLEHPRIEADVNDCCQG